MGWRGREGSTTHLEPRGPQLVSDEGGLLRLRVDGHAGVVARRGEAAGAVRPHQAGEGAPGVGPHVAHLVLLQLEVSVRLVLAGGR